MRKITIWILVLVFFASTSYSAITNVYTNAKFVKPEDDSFSERKIYIWSDYGVSEIKPSITDYEDEYLRKTKKENALRDYRKNPHHNMVFGDTSKIYDWRKKEHKTQRQKYLNEKNKKKFHKIELFSSYGKSFTTSEDYAINNFN